MEARVGETFRKRLIVFYIPLFLFLVALLFPFYWMLITSLKPDFELYNARNAPFFVWHPTLSHWWQLFQNTLFTRWAWNTLCIATASTMLSTVCRCARRVCAVPFNLSRFHELRDHYLYHLPGPTDFVVYSSGISHCRVAPLGFAMGLNLDISNFFGTFFSMVTDGLF